MKMLILSIASLFAGAALTLLLLSLYYSHADPFAAKSVKTSATTIIDLIPKNQSRYTLTLSASGKGLGLFPIKSFASADFPFFALALHNYEAIDRIRLVWRDNHASKPYSHILPGIPRQKTIIATAALPDWKGEILGLGLLIEGRPGANVEVIHASLQPWSQRNLLATIFASWSAFNVWQQKSINSYEAATNIGSPFMQVPIVALWIGLSLIFFLLSRLIFSLSRNATWASITGIVFASWLVIDGFWQRSLLLQLQDTWADKDDKAASARAMIGSNVKIKQLIKVMRQRMDESEARVFVNSDRPYNANRAAYEFYPVNVYWHRREIGNLPIKQLRAGDYIALVEPTTIMFEDDGKLLRTVSGEHISATQIWTSADGALYKVE